MVEDMLGCKPEGYFGLIIKLKNGTTWLYDSLDNYMRKLPDDSNDQSEEEFKAEFGMRLQRKMMYRRMTQTDLANATGIPQQQISKYIRGYRVPTFYNLDKIARALDCTIDELRYV